MKKLTAVFLSIVIAACCFILPISAKSVTLPQNTTIVISANSTLNEQAAAKTLNDYLQKITGKSFSIVTDATQKADFEFAVALLITAVAGTAIVLHTVTLLRKQVSKKLNKD